MRSWSFLHLPTNLRHKTNTHQPLRRRILLQVHLKRSMRLTPINIILDILHTLKHRFRSQRKPLINLYMCTCAPSLHGQDIWLAVLWFYLISETKSWAVCEGWMDTPFAGSWRISRILGARCLFCLQGSWPSLLAWLGQSLSRRCFEVLERCNSSAHNKTGAKLESKFPEEKLSSNQ
jgi:hypothetical protein